MKHRAPLTSNRARAHLRASLEVKTTMDNVAVYQAKETLDIAHEISKLLDCGLDKEPHYPHRSVRERGEPRGARGGGQGAAQGGRRALQADA